jgi:hypothetical protein
MAILVIEQQTSFSIRQSITDCSFHGRENGLYINCCSLYITVDIFTFTVMITYLVYANGVEDIFYKQTNWRSCITTGLRNRVLRVRIKQGAGVYCLNKLNGEQVCE